MTNLEKKWNRCRKVVPMTHGYDMLLTTTKLLRVWVKGFLSFSLGGVVLKWLRNVFHFLRCGRFPNLVLLRSMILTYSTPSRLQETTLIWVSFNYILATW